MAEGRQPPASKASDYILGSALHTPMVKDLPLNLFGGKEKGKEQE